MSGQPNRYANSAEMFRNQYMDALNTRANVDDFNLQANKNFKATGSLPPNVKEMVDNRTTTEILADTEKLKLNIISELKAVMNTNTGSVVVQKIQTAPVNADGSFLVWVAQNITEIVKNLKRKYSIGIKGDQKDAENIVFILSDMYSKVKDYTGSVKQYFDSSGESKVGIKEGDLDALKREYQTITARLASKFPDFRSNKSGAFSFKNLIIKTNARIQSLFNLLQSDVYRITISQASGLTSLQDLSEINGINDRSKILFKILDNLPSPSLIKTLLNQLNQSIDNSKPELSDKILTEIYNLFPDESEIAPFFNVQQPQRIPDQPSTEGVAPSQRGPVPSYPRDAQENAALLIEGDVGIRQNKEALDVNIEYLRKDLTATMADILRLQKDNTQLQKDKPANYKKTIALNKKVIKRYQEDSEALSEALATAGIERQRLESVRPTPEQVVKSRTQGTLFPSTPSTNLATGPVGDSAQELRAYNTQLKAITDRINLLAGTKAGYITSIDQMRDTLYNDNITIATRRQLNTRYADTIQNLEDLEAELEGLSDAKLDMETRMDEINTRSSGSGLKKRRGRPKGSGIAFKDNIDHAKGIQPVKKYHPFGKYFVNSHKLNHGNVLSIRSKSGTNVREYPSRVVSPHMASVVKTIIGGGVPSWNDMEKLTEEERDYLYKVSKRAEFADKISIPTPSKDKLEKDIHEFEVCKGEIMAGNDSKELIKKFKLLIIKLSKNGTIPKREATEVMQELLELGY